MIGSILSYQQIDPVKLQYKIDLKKLFPDQKARDRFKKNGMIILNLIRAIMKCSN
jgi:hypothetical protein